MNKPIRAFTLLGTSLMLTACVSINKFDTLVPLVNGDEVTFTLPDKDLADPNSKFVLYDIGVEELPCDKDCVVWEMVRRMDSGTEPVSIATLPIKYGVTLPNLETRVLKPLQKGRYRAGATFEITDSKNVTKVKKVVGGFSIE